MGISRELTLPSFSHLSNTVECFWARHSARVRETWMKTSQRSRTETCQQSKQDMKNIKGILWSSPCLPIDSLFLLLFPFCSWEKWGAGTFVKSLFKEVTLDSLRVRRMSFPVLPLLSIICIAHLWPALICVVIIQTCKMGGMTQSGLTCVLTLKVICSGNADSLTIHVLL